MRNQNNIGSINSRICELVDKYTLTVLARRTDTPAANVYRYTTGAKVPADFCAKLARELSLSPAWILHGTGNPSLEDVSADTSGLAGSLLELVRAMAAVEHVKIGALSGKPNLKTIRELSDAMIRYEGIRRRLNELSAPALRRVLDDLRGAMDRADMALTDELSHAAAQLGRLCSDTKLVQELVTLQGRLAFSNSNIENMLKLTRRVTTFAIYGSNDLGSDELETLAENMAALTSLGRSQEALRIGEAALALAAEDQCSSGASRVKAELALVDIVNGRLHLGLQKISDARGGLTGHHRARADGILVRALLYSSAIDIPTAITMYGDSRAKARVILDYASTVECEDELAEAIDYWDRAADFRGAWQRRDRAGILLAALKGETSTARQATAAVVKEELKSSAIPVDFRLIVGAQLYRVLGLEKEAALCFRKACKSMRDTPNGFFLGLPWLFRHTRNALVLGNKVQQRDAKEFFKRHVELGYHFVSGFLTT